VVIIVVIKTKMDMESISNLILCNNYNDTDENDLARLRTLLDNNDLVQCFSTDLEGIVLI
jgi:hypothetical protein